MFGTLLESKARREREGKGAAVSVVIHAGLIVLAVVATATADPGPVIEPDDTLVIYNPPPAAPRQPTRPDDAPPTGGFVQEDLSGMPPLDPPIDVPEGIPDIDVTAPSTNPDDWKRGARRPGESHAGPSDAGTVANPMFPFQVDKPVVAAGGCAPRYPEMLKSANLEGRVLAQFVVNEEGRVVDGTFKVLDSTNELFTQAVRACLPSLKFWPAEVQAKKVSQLVQQPFVFALERR